MELVLPSWQLYATHKDMEERHDKYAERNLLQKLRVFLRDKDSKEVERQDIKVGDWVLYYMRSYELHKTTKGSMGLPAPRWSLPPTCPEMELAVRGG